MTKQSFADKLRETSEGLARAGAKMSASVEVDEEKKPRELPEGIDYLKGAVDTYLQRVNLPRRELQVESHRNGETEPPTISEEFYWLDCNPNSKYGASQGIVYLMPKDEDVWQVADTFGTRIEISEIDGRWWGPITPPWESD